MALSGRQVLRLMLAQVCVHSAMTGTRLAAPLLALKLGYSAAAVGVLLALFALSAVFLALPAGRLADRHGLHLGAGRLELAHLVGDHAQHVGVQTAAQTLVGRDDDQAHLTRATVLHHERMLVLGRRLRQVGRDDADLVRIRTSRTHAILRLAHLGRGDHLHGLGDLLRVLEALDLAANFLACRHDAAPV